MSPSASLALLFSVVRLLRHQSLTPRLLCVVVPAVLQVSKSMGQKKILKRSKVKPFVKFVNFNHLMPTRYSLTDLDLKTSVKPEAVRKAGDGRIEARKAVKKQFEERYLSKTKQSGGSQYFFAKLRF